MGKGIIIGGGQVREFDFNSTPGAVDEAIKSAINAVNNDALEECGCPVCYGQRTLTPLFGEEEAEKLFDLLRSDEPKAFFNLLKENIEALIPTSEDIVEETLNYTEAMSALHKGNHMSRLAWNNVNEEVVLSLTQFSGQIVPVIKDLKSNTETTYIPTTEDVNTADWFIMFNNGIDEK